MVDHEALDVEDVIGETWPLNGPYGEYETRNAASALRELVRYLNYATQYAEGVPYPSVAGSVVNGAASAVALLDQTFDQLTQRVTAFQAEPGLYGDDAPTWGERNATGVAHAEQAAAILTQARRDAHQLHRTLSDAARHLGRLGIT